MAQIVDIKKVIVGPRFLDAIIEIPETAPRMTSDDPEGTARIMGLMPALANHVCLGDSSPKFGDVFNDTEVAHLLEHVTVELLACTNVAGDITSGRTSEMDERSYDIQLACPDDVLVIGALSSAVWILEWAYNGGGDPAPDVDAIAGGLAGLVQSLGADSADQSDEIAEEEYPEVEHADQVEYEDAITEPPESADPDSTLIADVATANQPSEPEPTADELDEPDDISSVAVKQTEGPEAGKPERDIYDDSPALDDWNMIDIPKPRPVR